MGGGNPTIKYYCLLSYNMNNDDIICQLWVEVNVNLSPPKTGCCFEPLLFSLLFPEVSLKTFLSHKWEVNWARALLKTELPASLSSLTCYLETPWVGHLASLNLSYFPWKMTLLQSLSSFKVGGVVIWQIAIGGCVIVKLKLVFLNVGDSGIVS